MESWLVPLMTDEFGKVMVMWFRLESEKWCNYHSMMTYMWQGSRFDHRLTAKSMKKIFRGEKYH